jgi:hypothetical protein
MRRLPLLYYLLVYLMADRPPATPPPTASVQDVLDVLANASPSSMQVGISILNDIIGNAPVDWPSGNSADVADPLAINDTLVFPFDPQQLLWDELTVDPFVDFGKHSVQNTWVGFTQLITTDSNPRKVLK